ncbi:MAG: protein kinase [Deltaproteobacteria bacterium]|nr:protein kinase [Deltaproteobacteria bacterium]
MPHDRAQRPDGMSQSGGPAAGSPAAGGGAPPPGGGTYFLGRYRVVDEIGIGGMASVHLARMDGPGGFQKWVAIKKIHPHLVEDDSFVQMFLDEARVAARISHPNVATVFDLGKSEDTYWIAMEYLHGEPLREVMRRTEELGTAMPPEIACRVIADAAEGLHAAHELLGKNGEKLNLVHRDVTPHNLFVTYDGVTKVVDFGIAKFSSRMSHTRAGTLKGKLAYMSPEQVHGEGIDRRTDIFALGVVLWELTTGQRLFRMESDLDTLAKVQECNVPRPSTLIRGYPVDLEKIVMKALAKNRGERFRTARELSRALQSLLMRRGLFIASDEVAAYTQSIFTDRIQKREAHLRWAAEVTQTINVDQLLSKPKIGPEFTSSDVQSQPPKGGPQPSQGVRPAAGMPAPNPSPALDDLKSTGPSLPTAPRAAPAAPRPAAGQPATQRPPPTTVPRPAAGMPPTMASPVAPPAEMLDDDEQHAADADGPTIQALPPGIDDVPTQGGGRALPNIGPSLMDPPRTPMRSEPPTLMEVAPGSQQDGPTIMGNARAAAAAVEPADIEPDDLEDDQDQTMVANTRAEAVNPLASPPVFPQPSARGGGPPSARGGDYPNVAPFSRPPTEPTAGPPRPIPQRFASTAQMPPQPSVPPLLNPLGFPMQAPMHGGHPGDVPLNTGEVAFAETMGLPNQGMGGPPEFIPRSGQVPTDPSNPGPPSFIPRQARMAPTVPRAGGPSYDNRTMTAQRFKRRPPMWVVAALSCSIALLIAGVVIAIVSASSSGPEKPRVTGPTSTTGTTGGGASNAAAAGSSGPFSSARAAFNSAVAQPGSSAAPTTPPSPGAAPPPAMTAAATSDAPPPVATTAAPPPPVATAAAPPATTVAAAPPTPPAPAAPTPIKTATAVAAPPPPTPVRTATPVPAAPAPAPPKPASLGAITVVCMPKCDQIVDNGTSLGPGHIFNRPVPAGRHVLQLSAPNGVKKNLVIEVVADQTKEVRMSMDK